MPYPPAFDNAWNEAFPPDTQPANLLGQDIRSMKSDIRERLALLSGTFANRPSNMDAVFGGVGYGILYFSTDTAQIFQWTGVAWVDVTAALIPPVTPPFPINAVDLATQGANIAPTTIITPAANGFYRISAYLVLTRAATSSSTLPNSVVIWTDGDTNVGQSLVLTGTTNTNLVGQTVNSGVSATGLFAKAGTPIQYNTTGYLSSGATSMQYAIHLRLEGPF